MATSSNVTLKKTAHSIFIEALEWRDKMYGNSYHATHVSIDGKLVLVMPKQYGYGSAYYEDSIRALGFKSYGEFIDYCRVNNITIYDTKNTALKREVKAYGEVVV